MNGLKYAEWAEHYDPEKKELYCLTKHGIDFEMKRILEVGCGTGRFTARVLPQCSELFGIDPDENALSVLKSRLIDSRLTVSRGALETVSLKQNYYHFVIFPWSMYLINEKEKNLSIAYNSLVNKGNLIDLQANSGEYEEEIAQLYCNYNPLSAYQTAYDTLPSLIEKVFGNVICDTLQTHFYFDSIDQVVDNSLFFIEDEEGHIPDEKKINCLKERLPTYMISDGRIRLSDNVSIFIAKKEL